MQLTHKAILGKAGLAMASLTLLGLAANSPAHAAGNPVYMESSNSQFGVLNPTTGAYTLIGTTSELIAGMGFGADGKLYGLAQDGTSSLFVIDTATAALTLVGNTGVSESGGFGFGATSDGTLYADGAGITYQINPTTAATMTLGSLGFVSPDGLNGDDHGHLYLADSSGLYQVSRTTGNATLIGPSSYGNAYGLADTGGILYAVNTTGSIFSVNTATGASTLTATYDVATDGSVYATAAKLSPVPEASTTVSFGLLLCLGLGGLVWNVRRKKASAGE